MDKDTLHEILIEALDKNFPKGECKERGCALMLVAQVLIDSKLHLNTRAVKRLSEKEEDKLYTEFTSRQIKHDCPGYDCATCYQCFLAVKEAIKALDTRQRLNEEEVKKVFNNFNDSMKELASNMRINDAQQIVLAKAICNLTPQRR